MNVAQETLGLRRQGFSPCLSLLMSAFALLIPPATLSGRLHRLTERSPTNASISFNPLIRRIASRRPLTNDPSRNRPQLSTWGGRLDFDGALVSAALFERLTSQAKLASPKRGRMD
jgi:hypothetical protein